MHAIDDSNKEILIEVTPGDSTLQGYNGGEDKLYTFGFIIASSSNSATLCPFQPFIR